MLGTLHGRRVAFLARHGEGHMLLPGEVPARANIHALKHLGVERVFAASAGGSLQSHLAPGHAVVPEQLIDRTRGRAATFFGEDLVAHIGFADPFCPELTKVLVPAARASGVTTHEGSTLVTARKLVPAATQRRLAPLLARYWEPVDEAATLAGGGGA